MKALLSVSDKSGLDRLALTLVKTGYELYATSGTMKYLLERKINVHSLEEITGFSELASGRVKTLNEKIFEMILSTDEGFDLVVVNLYPFNDSIEFGIDAMIDNFDIGGVALMRASAKNYNRVAILPSSDLYGWFCENSPLDVEKRRFLAKVAMETVVRYDSTILSNLFDSHMSIAIKDVEELKYGENPHQRAWIGKVAGMPSFLDGINVAKGKLSYNNYVDLLSATKIVSDCGEGAVAVVKHTNPCGVSKYSDDPVMTFERAMSGDPQSAYGGVLCINGALNVNLAKSIKPHFFDIIAAKSILPEAIKILEKKSASLVEFKSFVSTMEWRISDGIALVQESDTGKAYCELKCVTVKKPSVEEMNDVEFGLEVVRHVKSNAVILIKDGMLIGMGAGQPSRVDSARISIEKAKRFGHSTKDSVMISDGFFPFSDSIDMGIAAGIKCFVEPGGSKRDDESIDMCDKNGAAMIFTGKRLFKH